MTNQPGRGHDGSLDYHHRMLSDSHRVTAYDLALRALVTPGATVLDAGAGTGVLAMLAARAGAGRVIAVESMDVANLAHALVTHNGLGDRVAVVREDLRALAPMAEVDLIVSDCIGRFLVDDQMMAAMQAAFTWLRPGGKVIPADITLVVAPVEVLHFGVVDGFTKPILGLDFAPAEHVAVHGIWAGALAPGSLLAAPQDFATWHLPGPAPAFDHDFSFTFSRSGRLRGIAGWFRATMAPGVVLETAPGVETHWHQVFMPLPATAVAAGDRLDVRLFLEPGGYEPLWARTGRIVTGAGEVAFDLRVSTTDLPPAARWRTAEGRAGESADVLNELGAAAWVDGQEGRASALFEDAAMALAPGEDVPGLWENIGIARHTVADWLGAIQPLLRALDGDLTSREQSLRLLVDACMRSSLQADGGRYLDLYQATFGPHPAGWAR